MPSGASEPHVPPRRASGSEPAIVIEHPAPDQLLVRLSQVDSGLWHNSRPYEWVAGFRGTIIIDLGGAPVITSVFAGWLVGLVRAAHPNRVTVRACSERVREILALLRLDLLVDIEPPAAGH